MKRESYPMYTVDKGVYTQIRKFACDVLLPDSYDKAKHYIWYMMVHGVGERSAGTQDDLDNITLGFKQADGTRMFAIATDDIKKAVDKYNIVIVLPTYTDFFEPAKVDLIYDHMLVTYSVTSRFAFDGFSLGGGAFERYATSSLQRAKNLIVGIPNAPTHEGTTWKNIVDANLPIHFFVNDNDTNGATNLSVTLRGVNAINALNPSIKAYYTAFHASGHGSYNEATSLTSPVAPGGQGIINISENIYEWGIDVFNNGPRPMKSGTVVTPPPPPTTSTVKPIVSYTITGTTAHLIGSKSIGYKEGYDGVWSLESAPTGITSKLVFPTGSSYIDATAQLPVEGTYVFKFTLKGADPVQMTVQRGTATPVEKKAASYSIALKLLTFDDGSTEAATAVITTGSGKQYTV